MVATVEGGGFYNAVLALETTHAAPVTINIERGRGKKDREGKRKEAWEGRKRPQYYACSSIYSV